MRAILSPTRDPGRNLALEEILFREGEDLLLLWRSDPCVVIGRNQNAFAEANLRYCEAHGVLILRRFSGGGAVYHDPGNVNCSLSLAHEGEYLSYDPFLSRFLPALHALGVPAERRGASDVVLAGKKLCGTAQAAAKNRVLTHATLLCRADLAALSAALRPGRAILSGGGVASNRSEVTNCGLDPAAAVRGLAAIADTPLTAPTEAEMAAVEALAQEKYADFAWNFGRSPRFTATAGALTLSVRGGRIETEGPLCGLPYLPSALPAELSEQLF